MIQNVENVHFCWKVVVDYSSKSVQEEEESSPAGNKAESKRLKEFQKAIFL